MTPRLEGLFASPQHYEKYKARLDKKLTEFRFGFMSDAKWRKLFATICAESSPARQCEIYEIFGSCVHEIRFALPAADYAQGICENYILQRQTTSEMPTLYAEIEYIEFAKFYDFASRGTQNLKIYGYKR